MTDETRLVALQSLPVWLPATSPWLDRQVRSLPETVVESVVVAERVANLDRYPHPRLHSLDEAPTAVRTWDKALRRLRIRRHLGIVDRVARSSGADVLHSHWGDQGWRDMEVARKRGLPHVVQFYGKEVNFLPQSQPVWRQRYAEMLADVTLVLCEGPFMAGRVVDLGAPPERVEVLHLGVDVDELRYQPRTWRPGGTLKVLIAASFREKKGIPDALSALALVRDAGHDISVTIVGDASEDVRSHAEKARIIEILMTTGLDRDTVLLGYQSRNRLLEEAYRHHVFLSPSRTADDGDTEGGAPVALVDMAATGMPIVTTRHCDIPHIVQDGVTGLLADEGDVDGIANQLLWLVEHADEWQSLVERGRGRMEQEYDAAVLGRRLARRYVDLLR